MPTGFGSVLQGRLTAALPSSSTTLVILIVVMIGMIGAGFGYITEKQGAIADLREATRQMRMARQAVMEANTAILHTLVARRVDLYPFQRALDKINAHARTSFPQAVKIGPDTTTGDAAVRTLVEIWNDVLDRAGAGDYEKAVALYENRGTSAIIANLAQAYFNELDAIEKQYSDAHRNIETATSLTLLLQILTGLLSIVAFLYALGQSRREAKARAAAVITANETRVQVEQLFEMADTLQSATDHTDANAVLRSTASGLLSGFSGALYVFNNSRDRLIRSTTWNHPAPDDLPDTIGLSQCWALKRGKTHINRPDTHKLCCEHHANNGEYLLELPMMARGEILGLLQVFERGPGAEARLAAIKPVATSLADAMSLALSNLALREKLRSQALRDPLTGLYNRRYMEDTIQRFVRLAEREKREVSVIMIDLDHFKRLNDQYGHAKGDSVLRDAASAVIGQLRETDVACRYGGEELIVLLPNCGLEMAAQKAEAIRLAIESLSELDGAKVSASLGVSTIPLTARAAKDLVASADAALYLAKQAGRNRVVKAMQRVGVPAPGNLRDEAVEQSAAVPSVLAAAK